MWPCPRTDKLMQIRTNTQYRLVYLLTQVVVLLSQDLYLSLETHDESLTRILQYKDIRHSLTIDRMTYCEPRTVFQPYQSHGTVRIVWSMIMTSSMLVCKSLKEDKNELVVSRQTQSSYSWWTGSTPCQPLHEHLERQTLRTYSSVPKCLWYFGHKCQSFLVLNYLESWTLTQSSCASIQAS